MKPRSITIALRILGICLILYGGLVIAVPYALPYAVAWSPNHGSVIDPANDPNPEKLAALGVDRHLRVAVGPPNASISCFLLNPDTYQEPVATILILHGHRDEKLSQIGLAEYLASVGYRVVIVDHRGHGLSTGDYLGYGAFESNDMVAVLDRLEQEELIAGSVGIVGFSYGGAVGIQCAAKDRRVQAVVSVSTFASLRLVVGDYVDCFLPFVAPLLSESQIQDAVERAGNIGGYSPDDANTEQAAHKLRIPLLIVHGEQDWRIPPYHGKRLSQAAGGICKFIPIPNRGHRDILAEEAGPIIFQETTAWFDEYLHRK